MKNLSLDDVLVRLKQEVYIQDYSKKKMIDGVKIVEVKRFVGEDGTFEELTRINENGGMQEFPDFKIRQINKSKLLAGSIKAWHLHYKQEDVWYVPPEDHMILGMWDLRNDSDTKDIKMKLVLGNGSSKLVLLPRGVAHGVVNVSKKPGTILYFVNEQFNFSDPDEKRLKWDAAGADFWEIKKE
ncbi:spore coat protein [Candidatus Roizmanbacteria bacterium CG_4_9_14_3_um_filter_33_18]|uniref:Spore coat protein n=1 Tax=Candidatus Roizmanbacteria bacterium CG_4_9_14_3_um_filter_33_18 TaxID=1974841 RepID=A0A2M7XY09_9BACT|nr:MAG: spore coat protein [Candidatus Roizmanbacteria bacterium CG_4_9_14_3_um_filter_33_18]